MRGLPRIPTLLSGDWLPSPFLTSTPQPWVAVGDRCPQTCWDRAVYLLFPGPSLVGRTQKYCVAQPKHSFLRLPLFMKRKSNPGIHALMASSQVLQRHFWGDALPRAGCSLQGNKNPPPSSPAHLWWWWASSSLPLSPSHPMEALGDRSWVAGLLPQSWVVLVHSSQENRQRGLLCYCLWPGALASVCFGKLTWVLIASRVCTATLQSSGQN